MTILRKILLHFITILSAIFIVHHVSYGQVQFVQNKGQWDSKVQYRADFSTGSFFLEDQGFTVDLHNPADLKILSEQMHGHNANPATMGQPIVVNSHAYTVSFLGGKSFVQSTADKIQPYYNNYFSGNDKSKWAGGCKIAQAVSYQNIYPNVDVRYYSDGGKMKYDIIIHPGGDVDKIALQYRGIDKLEVLNKELLIKTSVGAIKELYPYSYQIGEGKRNTVNCKYVVKNNIVRFKVTEYDPKSTLVIDPTLIFSTFTGSTAENWGYTATPGPDGSLFAGGIAFNTGYPISPGAYQTTYGGGVNEDGNGGYDIAIMKFSPDGVNRVYATYLGGSRNEQPHSMICDAQGNLFVAGRSNSTNYPGTLSGAGGGYDIVITKLNAAGSAILGSIKIGGSSNDGVNIRGKYLPPDGADATRRNYGDDARSEVILDNGGNILLASSTQSNDFPVTPGTPIQTNFGGGRQDGVILKLTPSLSTILFSTYFGGSGDDACFVLSQNPVTGKIYVAGGTTSNNLQGTNPLVMQATYQGGATDGFITEIANDGSALIRTTYQGTGGNDLIYGIQFDKFGFPYIMGTTTGAWTVQVAQGQSSIFNNAGSKQFISKLDSNLSVYKYSTTFGTNAAVPNLSPIAFLVDRCQNVYVSGWGGGINIFKSYPSAGTSGMPEVNPLPGIPPADGQDLFFFVLEKDGKSQLFGTHFGQNGGFGDHVDGGTSRFDANGIIYQAVCGCGDGGRLFFTTPGVWSGSNNTPNGDGCNEAAVKIEMNFAGIGASVKATINGVIDTIGCVPLTVRFTDTLAKGKMYIWDYGDQYDTRIDTTFAPNNSTSHTYTRVGQYRLMLVSIDSATCNISDTAYVIVKVGNNNIDADFSFFKLDSCNSLRYQFVNQTVATVPTYTSQSFLWDFGDNTPKVRAGFGPVIHTYASTGSYKVTLLVDDTTFCNAPDSAVKTLRISPNVKAIFSAPSRGCVPFTLKFKNLSLGGTDWIWDFGNGDGSTDFEPTYTYNSTGIYKVRLIAIDTSTCNKRDTSAYFTITIFAIPKAGFSWTPNPPQVNALTRFTNLSNNANRYLWNFGDGETSTEVNPSHQYNTTGTFRATLYAYNVANCVDSITQDVPILIVPLLDVPNAFTPGRFGENGIVKVKGFGIGIMNWKIYNRWGQVVFATTNRNEGWNGLFKGVLQPMDVYTYTLDVEFTDGQKLRKTGDISLLR